MADSIQFAKLIADETRYEAAQGIPINNADQQLWLVKLHQLIAGHLNVNQPLIVPSSALKATCRCALRGGHRNYDLLKEQGENLKWKTKLTLG